MHLLINFQQKRYQKHFNKPDLSGGRLNLETSRLAHSDHIFNDFSELQDFSILQTHSPLKLGIKIYEFYAAPITKFWLHSVRKLFVLFL